MPSYNLLGPTQLVQDVDFVGDAVKAAGWFGIPEGLHTVAIYTSNFTGRVIIEGSIAMDPCCAEWFPIKLTPCGYVEFPLNQDIDNTNHYPFDGESGVVAYTFRSNILWVRARIWRSYFLENTTPQYLSQYGNVSKITIAY